MNARRLTNKCAVIAALSISMCIGCARSDLVDVSGNVTWKGAPVPDGEIIFFPSDKAKPPAAGRITDGAYKFKSKAGTMKVTIEAARSTGKRDPEYGFLISELYIPPRYNKDSTLSADVTLDGENRFDFALTDKP